jgi:delta 1-pyrroline-5-carboxylate dehydrogenase
VLVIQSVVIPVVFKVFLLMRKASKTFAISEILEAVDFLELILLFF